MTHTQVIIMAAEEGKHMKSSTAKVLNKVNFKPMIDYVLQAASGISAQKPVVVIGHKGEDIKKYLTDRVFFAENAEQLKSLITSSTIVLLSGDLPQITATTLKKALALHKENQNNLTFLGKSQTNAIFTKESFLSATASDLTAWLAKEEKCDTFLPENPLEFKSCDTRSELAAADKAIRSRINNALMDEGVTIINPDNTYIEQGVQVGKDTIIYPGAVLEGTTKIGEGCVLYPNCNIKNCVIGNNVEIKSSTLIDSTVGDETTVGPYAYVRPNSEIGSHVKVGDFVEVKKSKIGDGTKISHLTYVGDSVVGKNVNFGCGTVTVNYDGIHKFTTEIGDGAFIGCNTNLVAPVKVGNNTFIAAGSTITDEVPEDAFAIARQRQVVKENWIKPKDKDK